MNPTQIPPELWQQVLATLAEYAPFTDEGQLRDIFADPRLKPWQQDLPTKSQNFRDLLISVRALLVNKTSVKGDNALVLFLQVLAGLIDPGDERHTLFLALAEALQGAESANGGIDKSVVTVVTKPPLPDITIQVEVLKITLHTDGENWKLQVTNTVSTLLRHVTLVLHPSTAVAVHPTQFALGTIAAEATVTADRLIIRPNPDSGDSCQLPFKIDYRVARQRERQEAVFHIPI
jgi:hypothetical protein